MLLLSNNKWNLFGYTAIFSIYTCILVETYPHITHYFIFLQMGTTTSLMQIQIRISQSKLFTSFNYRKHTINWHPAIRQQTSGLALLWHKLYSRRQDARLPFVIPTQLVTLCAINLMKTMCDCFMNTVSLRVSASQ